MADAARKNKLKMRVISYIDVFNLFYGMKESSLQACYWLNVASLCQSIVPAGWTISGVNYFTASVRGNPDKNRRQSTYLEAIAEQNLVRIIYGNYRSNPINCTRCNHSWTTFTEKKTDVGIATGMLIDAFQDRCDVFQIVSGDSDLIPPIEAIRELFPQKQVFICFPPKRFTRELQQKSHRFHDIKKADLDSAQLPDPVVRKKDGHKLECPLKWM